MIPLNTQVPNDAYPVLLDGKVLGHFPSNDMENIMKKLRTFKLDPNDNRISSLTELAFVPRRPNGQFPGLFIFTGAARMMRPVLNLAMNTVEWIGKFVRHHIYQTVCFFVTWMVSKGSERKLSQFQMPSQ